MAVTDNLTFLDGGLSEELFRLGCPDDRHIWSARSLVDEKWHDNVVQGHKNFIEAGAEYITTGNFSVTYYGFQKVGLEDKVCHYTQVAVNLAKRAVSESSNQNTKILGSFPPITECYRSDLVLEDHEAIPVYEEIAKGLKDVDVFLGETLSTTKEVFQIVQAIQNCNLMNKPIWISFSLNEHGVVRSGEQFSEAVYKVLEVCPNVTCFLVNCCSPESSLKCFNSLSSEFMNDLKQKGIQLGVMANALPEVQTTFIFGSEPSAPIRKDMGSNQYEVFVQKCVEKGITVIGGCCGIYPEHIQQLKNNLEKSRQL